jgi:hypothetical protein
MKKSIFIAIALISLNASAAMDNLNGWLVLKVNSQGTPKYFIQCPDKSYLEIVKARVSGLTEVKMLSSGAIELKTESPWKSTLTIQPGAGCVLGEFTDVQP